MILKLILLVELLDTVNLGILIAEVLILLVLAVALEEVDRMEWMEWAGQGSGTG